MSNLSAARKAFNALIAQKSSAGLNAAQSSSISLRQCVRDALAGQLDKSEVAQLVEEEETKYGSSPTVARQTAEDALAGKPAQFACRPNPDSQPCRRRYFPAQADLRWEAECNARSAELSAWANGTLALHNLGASK
jgi:hypothetical protein